MKSGWPHAGCTRLLGISFLALVLTACGGSSSSSRGNDDIQDEPEPGRESLALGEETQFLAIGSVLSTVQASAVFAYMWAPDVIPLDPESCEDTEITEEGDSVSSFISVVANECEVVDSGERLDRTSWPYWYEERMFLDGSLAIDESETLTEVTADALQMDFRYHYEEWETGPISDEERPEPYFSEVSERSITMDGQITYTWAGPHSGPASISSDYFAQKISSSYRAWWEGEETVSHYAIDFVLENYHMDAAAGQLDMAMQFRSEAGLLVLDVHAVAAMPDDPLTCMIGGEFTLEDDYGNTLNVHTNLTEETVQLRLNGEETMTLTCVEFEEQVEPYMVASPLMPY